MLEGLEAVRKRPGMYVGSTDTRGLMHCLWEVIDNSVDEALSGVCTEVDVTLHDDGSVSIGDDGRGIPVDIEPRTGLTGLEVVFTRLHAGGKFGGGSYSATGGLHGVGAAVVNALSSRLDVEVDKSGATWAMSFARGIPAGFAGEGPDAEHSADNTLHKIGKTAKNRSGSRVRYWPDPQIFVKNAGFSYDELLARARQTAFLVPGLQITVRDERAGQLTEEKFRYEGGLSEFCDYLSSDEPVTEVMRFQGEDTFTETVPVLDENGQMVAQDVERVLGVDIALRWGSGYDTIMRSFANIIATPKGGTHVQGFEKALTKTFNDVMRSNRYLKNADSDVIKDDILEGLTTVITVRLAEPQFEGQTKEVLGTPAVSKLVNKIVSEHLKAFLTSNKSAQKAKARQLMDKVAGAARTRLLARQQRDNQRRKNALESSALPAKLADCRSSDVDGSELFIVEGDSALGTAKSARDSQFQALLPIRGKILNVQKASANEMLKNAECSSIIQVLGAGSGPGFQLDSTRYERVIFMADADSDGAHIRCLLATLFFRYMRPMVEAGRVFSAVPPLHRLEFANSKKDAFEYTYSDQQLQRRLAELEKKSVRVKEPIQRYKGLGEMDADQLAETTMNPRSRLLRRLTIDDAEDASAVFELLMGNEVAPRKEFLVQGAYEIEAEQIDA